MVVVVESTTKMHEHTQEEEEEGVNVVDDSSSTSSYYYNNYFSLKDYDTATGSAKVNDKDVNDNNNNNNNIRGARVTTESTHNNNVIRQEHNNDNNNNNNNIKTLQSSSSNNNNNNNNNRITETSINNTQPPLLTSTWEHYARNQTDDVIITRSGIIDQIIISSSSNNNNNNNNNNIGLCHIALFGPHSFLLDYENKERIEMLDVNASIGGTAAFYLAIQMLNDGDGSVIKEIEGLNERCPIRFTGELFDSGLSQQSAVHQLLHVLLERNSTSTKSKPEVCAILGETGSAITISMATITSTFNIPQLSAWSTSSQLDERAIYPLFGRIVTSDKGLAIPIILYLKERNVQHLGVIHWDDQYGRTYVSSLLQNAKIYHPKLQIISIDIPLIHAKQDDYIRAVQVLANTKFHWFFGTIGYKDFEPLMKEAIRYNIINTGKHVWLFHGTSMYPLIEQSIVTKDSILANTLNGIGMITYQGGRPGMNIYDKFHAKWTALNNGHDIEFLTKRQPQYPDEPNFNPPIVSSSIFDTDASRYASILFDETILFGLAACEAYKLVDNNNNTNNSTSIISLDGYDMFDAIQSFTFQGATGNVTLDPTTGSRLPETAIFRVINSIQVPINSTHVQFHVQDSDVFIDGKWSTLNPYIYNDGTTNIPNDLDDYNTDYNYIGTALRVTGLTMSVIVLISSIGFATWTIRKRNIHVIKASQPIFMLFLCTGTFIMGATIIPLSIDDEIINVNGCNVACMAIPWLTSTGFTLIFAALFSKMWRINRIINNQQSQTMMRRIKISAWDVMMPLIALLILNWIVLSVWTTISPLQWERVITSVDTFGRPIESRGYCTSDQFFIPFVIILVVIDVIALVIASIQSYQARNIATEFAETEYIGKAIFCMLLVSFVSIPTMILIWDNPKALYFAFTSIIFVTCMTVLLFIFIPKLISVAKTTPTTIQGQTRSITDSSVTSNNNDGRLQQVHSLSTTDTHVHRHRGVVSSMDDDSSEAGIVILVENNNNNNNGPNNNKELDDVRGENNTLRERNKELEAQITELRALISSSSPPESSYQLESQLSSSSSSPHEDVVLARNNDIKNMEVEKNTTS